jgi:hypothetical protein
MLAIPYLVVTKLLPKLDISSTKTNYLASLFFADNVNVYPQEIYSDRCDKNHQSGAAKHWDTQIISQPGGVNFTTWINPFFHFQYPIFRISI